MRRLQWLAVVMLAGAACSMATTRMERALDPTMERTIYAANYVQTATGITADARRLVRSDGFLYMADVAPQLRYLAVQRDSASYRTLRGVAGRELVRRDSTGLAAQGRYRQGAPFRAATAYESLRFAEALALGWRTFGDTASAVLAAQLVPAPPSTRAQTETDVAVEQCASAESSVATDPAAASATLAKYRHYSGASHAPEEGRLGLRGDDAGLVALACLTRLGLAVHDPDASVRFLERLLHRLDPLMQGNGRPDPGAAADVLLALQQALAAGPKYR